MNRITLSCLLVALALVGCENKPAATTTATSGSPAVSTNTTTTPAEKPKPTLDQLPADLKGDAYSYYGFGNDKPISFEWVSSTQPGIHSGTQSFTLKEIKGDEAIFTVERTGGLSDLGNETLSLRKDGVYVQDLDVAKISGDRLELPNELVPGKTWKNHQIVEFQGRKYDITMNWLVKGPAKVTTKAGQRDGLLIKGSGGGQIDKDKVTMVWQTWFVKDRGLVKWTVEMLMPGGKKQSTTFEEAKQ